MNMSESFGAVEVKFDGRWNPQILERTDNFIFYGYVPYVKKSQGKGKIL